MKEREATGCKLLILEPSENYLRVAENSPVIPLSSYNEVVLAEIDAGASRVEPREDSLAPYSRFAVRGFFYIIGKSEGLSYYIKTLRGRRTTRKRNMVTEVTALRRESFACETLCYSMKKGSKMSTTKPYKRKVHYYETDQMGIVHHSNYIRWFEEARIDFMEQMGLGYAQMEAQGILSPVLSVAADYLRMIHFGDTVTIEAYIKEYNGIKLTVAYEVVDDKTHMVHCRGLTKHCFINQEGKPLSLKQACPAFHEMFAKGLEEHKKTK